MPPNSITPQRANMMARMLMGLAIGQHDRNLDTGSGAGRFPGMTLTSHIARCSGAAITLTAIVLAASSCGSSSKDTSKASPKPKSKATSTASAAGGGGSTSAASTSNGGCDKAPASTMQFKAEPSMTVKPADKLTATITTSMGVMVADILPKSAPHAANNFVFLARKGFYHCLKFHRIIKGFMVQTGDPQGTGTGGPGYAIPDDTKSDAIQIGSLAMANAGPNTGGSQFFIVQGDQGTSLPPSYPVFGKVTSGLDVLDKIANAPVHNSDQGEPSAPSSPVYLIDVKISG